MEYKVIVTQKAREDLRSIGRYIAKHDNIANASYVMLEIEKTYKKLNIFPHRGSLVKDLLISKAIIYRQVFFKSYNIVYSIDEESKSVFIVLIIDGRRDMQKTLMNELPII